jgi:hypothetical protein
LALIVSRDVTQRDRADRHQPFNLEVPGGVSSIGAGGPVYEVAYLQIFQADAVRGYGVLANPNPGRRVLARPMHETGVSQTVDAPSGGVAIAADGSFAALVPARRALTWQLTDSDGTGVVRERNWISFQSGEIRVCANCHGVNKLSQTGDPSPTNEPQALHDLLAAWKLENDGGPTATPGSSPTPTAPGGSACSGGNVIEQARLRVRSASEISVRGKAMIPLPWQGMAPHLNGVRLTIAGVLDITVPGGAGWTVSSSGRRWRYNDRAGLISGVRRIDLMDRSSDDSGQISFRMRITNAPAVPAPGPVDLSVRFGDQNECATAHWNGPMGPAPLCMGNTSSMNCH